MRNNVWEITGSSPDPATKSAGFVQALRASVSSFSKEDNTHLAVLL